jgi:serine/threonine protein kinase
MGCGASTASRPPVGDDGGPVYVKEGSASNRKGRRSKEHGEEDKAAAKLQSMQRGRKDRTEIDAMNKSATVMQSRFRANKARSYAANLLAEREVVLETGHAGIKRNKAETGLLSVNEWQFGKMLGKGAYGQVYQATKKGESDAPVAVKVLSRSILKRKRVGRFGSAYDSVMGEISVMKKLDHQNIVRLYEVIDDPDEDLLFMIMECVSGGDLSGPVEAKRQVPEEELREWMTGLTLGLEHLHLCGVCHRDIKPENILWDKKHGVAKLSDFGISVFYKVCAAGVLRLGRCAVMPSTPSLILFASTLPSCVVPSRPTWESEPTSCSPPAALTPSLHPRCAARCEARATPDALPTCGRWASPCSCGCTIDCLTRPTASSI